MSRRERKPEDDGLRREGEHRCRSSTAHGVKLLRAKPGKNVTQLYYARQGLITEEMKYIAARENLGRSALADGNSFGASDPVRDLAGIRARRDRARGRAIIPQHQPS